MVTLPKTKAFPPDKVTRGENWFLWIDGNCETWAANFIRKNGGRAVWIDEQTGHEDLPIFIDHQVVINKGRYFDAINTKGVSDWRDLAFVRWTLDGTIAERIEYARKLSWK
jgi:hypothetical protein